MFWFILGFQFLMGLVLYLMPYIIEKVEKNS